MKIIRFLLLFTLLLSFTSVQGQSLKEQKPLFPKVVQKMKVYLGASETYLLKRCPNCIDRQSEETFRTIYYSDLEDEQFQSVFFYVSKSKKEMYEMILIAKDESSVNKLARDLLGVPNGKDGEWRFSLQQKKKDYTLAAWVFRNKLVIAGNLEGSEWESGFN